MTSRCLSSQQESCDTFVQVKKRRWKEKQGWGEVILGCEFTLECRQFLKNLGERKAAARGDSGAEGFKICERLVHV